jgi:hypothetical protein
MVLGRIYHDRDRGNVLVPLLRGKELPPIDIRHAEIEQNRIGSDMRV